jgi:hypothetical protein
VRVQNNRCDGSISHSGCFKFAASGTSRLVGLDVSHNTITVGDAGAIATQGIELFSTTKADDSAIQHFVIADNIIDAETAKNASAMCISLGGARHGSVRGNVLRDCGASGVEVIASYAVIANNTLDNTGPITWDANATSHTNVVITGNIMTRPSSRAIHLIQSGTNVLDTAIIAQNIIHAPAQAALRIQTSDNKSPLVSNLVITQNAFRDNAVGFAVIESFGATSQVDITGNRFTNIDGSKSHAIHIGAGGRGFNVRNNVFNGSAMFLNDVAAVAAAADNLVNGRIAK